MSYNIAAGDIAAGRDPGSATVLLSVPSMHRVSGGSRLTGARASCTRHDGAGPRCPTACKAMQPLLDTAKPRTRGLRSADLTPSRGHCM